MPANIFTLSNELLFEVLDHLPCLPRDRRAELVSLTMVCKRFHEIAMEMLHKDVYVEIAKVHRLVSLYVAQPKLAQLVRSIDLYRDADPDVLLELEAKKPNYYEPIIQSSGLNGPLQQMLMDDLRSQYLQAHFALLFLQTPNLQIFLLGHMSHEDIHFLDPVFFTGSPILPSSVGQDHVPTRDVQPYLREIIATQLKPRLTRLEIPFLGLWDVVGKHHTFDLSEYTQLRHVTAGINECMTVEWAGWGSEAVYKFAGLPRTLTHLTVGGSCWDLERLLDRLTLDKKPSGRMPNLHSLVLYMNGNTTELVKSVTQLCPEDPYSKKIFAHVQALENVGIATSLRYDSQTCLSYCLRLATLDPSYLSRYMSEFLGSLEVRGYFGTYMHAGDAMEVLRDTHDGEMEEIEQGEEEEEEGKEDEEPKAKEDLVENRDI